MLDGRIDVASDPRVVRITSTPKLGETLGFSVAVAGDLTGDRRANVVDLYVGWLALR